MSEDRAHRPASFVDDAHRYRLSSRIATGGMGQVWRATDTMLEREVAVKLLKPEYADDALFRSRFAAEARHSASLHHPGIAGVFDFGEARPTDGSLAPRPYLVMELVDGQPLSALLRPGEPLDPTATADLMAQAAEAIGVAHAAGIVHRDVKPANLLVTPGRQVKITDFGIARATEGLALTQSGQVLGTPQYLSPEQASGSRATTASDVYSLGVVAFECLSGRRPFVRENAVATALAHVRDPVPALPADVPQPLAAVVMRALAKDPAARFPNGSAFAAALRDPASITAAGATADTAAPTAVLATPEPATAVMPPAAVVPPPPPPPPPPPTASTGSTGSTGSTAAADVPPEPPAGERRRSGPPAWLVPLLALVVAGLAVLVWWLATSGGDPERPAPSEEASPSVTESPSETSQSPETVVVDEGDYLGRTVDQVSAELTARGLHVERSEQANPGDQPEGVVTGVSPSGTLTPGEPVTVSYWGPAPEEPSPSPSPTIEPTETPEPTPGGGAQG